MTTPIRSRIVWVELPDPQGKNRKVRPAVIVSPTQSIEQTGVVSVVAITTQFTQPLDSFLVELPWNHEGTARTGLREPSVAKCDWLAQVNVADIESYMGVVPSRQMIQIEMILARRSDQSDP